MKAKRPIRELVKLDSLSVSEKTRLLSDVKEARLLYKERFSRGEYTLYESRNHPHTLARIIKELHPERPRSDRLIRAVNWVIHNGQEDDMTRYDTSKFEPATETPEKRRAIGEGYLAYALPLKPWPKGLDKTGPANFLGERYGFNSHRSYCFDVISSHPELLERFYAGESVEVLWEENKNNRGAGGKRSTAHGKKTVNVREMLERATVAATNHSKGSSSLPQQQKKSFTISVEKWTPDERREVKKFLEKHNPEIYPYLKNLITAADKEENLQISLSNAAYYLCVYLANETGWWDIQLRETLRD